MVAGAEEETKEMHGCEAWGHERDHDTVNFPRHSVLLTLKPLGIWDVLVTAEICRGLRGVNFLVRTITFDRLPIWAGAGKRCVIMQQVGSGQRCCRFDALAGCRHSSVSREGRAGVRERLAKSIPAGSWGTMSPSSLCRISSFATACIGNPPSRAAARAPPASTPLLSPRQSPTASSDIATRQAPAFRNLPFPSQRRDLGAAPASALSPGALFTQGVRRGRVEAGQK